jgi:hypothetical protein
MWQDTTRKIKEPEARDRLGRFRLKGGLSWLVAIVVLSLAGVLAVIFVVARRP